VDEEERSLGASERDEENRGPGRERMRLLNPGS
jgi:hypothetical protein